MQGLGDVLVGQERVAYWYTHESILNALSCEWSHDGLECLYCCVEPHRTSREGRLLET
jgi:hypothetical protein